MFSLQVIKIIELIINEEKYLFEKTNDIYNLKTRKDSTLLDFYIYFCQKNLMNECRRALLNVFALND